MSHMSRAALCIDQEAASAQNKSWNKCTLTTQPFLCLVCVRQLLTIQQLRLVFLSLCCQRYEADLSFFKGGMQSKQDTKFYGTRLCYFHFSVKNLVLMWHVVCKAACHHVPSGNVVELSCQWGFPSVSEAQTPSLPWELPPENAR